MATLDILSHGRVDVGLGRTGYPYQLTPYGSDLRDTRGMWQEFADVLPRIWTQEEISYDGTYYQIPRREVLPKPVQQPHPPLCIGVTCASVTRRGGSASQRPSFALGWPPSVGHILVAFDGAERWAFFYLSFGARSLWDDMVPGSETLISGWAGANSRFAALREFAGKGLICFTVCAAQWWLCGENRQNSRFDGKSREFRPTPLRNAAPQRRWRRSSRRWNRDAG